MYVGTQSAALDENLTANVLNANDKNICKKLHCTYKVSKLFDICLDLFQAKIFL